MSIRVLATGFAVLLLAGTAWCDTLRVPADHATIQAAVNAAGDGDVIEIRGGTYDEDVAITDKVNLTVVGKGNVTIRGTDRGILATGCTGLTIEKIRGEGGTVCFEFRFCSNVLLQKFQAKDASRDGVYAMGSSNVRVVKGKVRDCGRDGVSFANDDPGDPVTGGEITKVKALGCGDDGIDVLGSNVTVTKCLVRDAGDDSFESDANGPGPVHFEDCKSRNCVDEGFELFSPASSATDCKSIRSRDDAFDVEGDGSTLTRCTSVKAGANGLEVEHANNVSLIDCKSIRADDDGIALIGAEGCLVDGCKSLRSGFDGLFIDDQSSNNTVRDTKASRNRDFDLDDEGANTTLEGDNKFKTVDPNGG